MNTRINLQDRILNVNTENFNELALEVFGFQSKNSLVYSEYLHLLKKQGLKPTRLDQIPFLPADIFKGRIIKSGEWNDEIVFESSGTTQLLKSKHHIKSLDWYHQISVRCFEYHYGPVKDYEFAGLLPTLNERPFSSLVSMFQNFLKISNSSTLESDFINDYRALFNFLSNAKAINKKIILFGLSFALLDFAKTFKVDASNLIIIETGGMKNSKKETDKESLLDELRNGFPNAVIHSEYGMTELISQAYAIDGMHYLAAPVLRFQISDPTDPGHLLSQGKRGIVNVIDLGNINTCSFLQTGDLGIIDDQKRLQVIGRYNPEEVRGCVQMYE